MDAQLADIRENTDGKRLEELNSNILDCTKNIKSNDTLFGISTYPIVKDKIDQVVLKYRETKKNIEASRAVFLKIYEEIDSAEGEEIVDLDNFIAEFQQGFNEELNKVGPEPEEDILVENRQINKDPITRQPIKVAVKSNVCHHIYDKEAILNYFQQRKDRAVKCPQAGCTNKNMKIEELVDDEETNRLIQSL